MRTIGDRLDAIREKPHHVRRQVAFLSAGVITGAIALSWLGLSLSTGAFALKNGNFAQVTSALSATPDNTDTADTPGVAGVAAAEAATEDTVAPGLGVVAAPAQQGGPSADPGDPSAGKNIIPF